MIDVPRYCRRIMSQRWVTVVCCLETVILLSSKMRDMGTHLGHEESDPDEGYTTSNAHKPEPESPRQVLDNITVDKRPSTSPLAYDEV